jgi:hypothetical protein
MRLGAFEQLALPTPVACLERARWQDWADPPALKASPLRAGPERARPAGQEVLPPREVLSLRVLSPAREAQ